MRNDTAIWIYAFAMLSCAENETSVDWPGRTFALLIYSSIFFGCSFCVHPIFTRVLFNSRYGNIAIAAENLFWLIQFRVPLMSMTCVMYAGTQPYKHLNSIKCNERALFILCIIIYQPKVRRAPRLIDVLWKIKSD